MSDVTSLGRSFATEHWTGIGALALVAVGVALPFQREGLFLVALVGVGYAAYSRATDAPAVELTLERSLSEATPGHDEEVTVTVTVENVGDATLPDLRLVDGVPPGLAVSEGTARLGTALRPGKRARYTYSVTAVRGAHEWEPLTAIVRDVSGSNERVAEVETETTMQCFPELSATSGLPLRGLTTPYSGQVATDVGGAGLEFHSTRRYRHGDPISRIDWNRYARTGKLSTLDFREERAATVVLLVDTREEAYVSPGEDHANAVERSADAAGQAFSALLSTGDRVGLANYGPESCWLAPSTGEDHRARARRLLGSHPAFSVSPSDGSFYPSVSLKRLRRRLPVDAQLVVFTPLVDDYVVSVLKRLDAYGHKVTVVSPDPTTDDSPGHRLARVERAARLRELRSGGLRVLDWGDRPLAVELARIQKRWSR